MGNREWGKKKIETTYFLSEALAIGLFHYSPLPGAKRPES